MVNRGRKFQSGALLKAALNHFSSNGIPLKRVRTGTRANIYQGSSGATIRINTSSDRVCLIRCEDPLLFEDPNTAWSIDGTKKILLAVPTVYREPGDIELYLLPVEKLKLDAIAARKVWIKSGYLRHPNNPNFSLKLDSGTAPYCGWARRWAEFRIETSSTITSPPLQISPGDPTAMTVDAIIQNARERLALSLGMEAERIELTFQIHDPVRRS